MRKMFSSDDIAVRDRFRLWREASRARLPPFEMWKPDGAPFEAQWQAAEIGGLRVSRTTFGPHSMEIGVNRMRPGDRLDNIVTSVRLSGTARLRQHDRVAIQRPGDLTVFDNAANSLLDFPTAVSTLRLEVPRERMERMLGPVRVFAMLNVDGTSPGASLARTFFAELTRVHETMSPEMAERMGSIGVDLLVASIAERMARETPRPIHGSVTVQRAKAYLEDNLGDASLDPPRLAAAVGVSLRRLQELFHERGRHISDWIWERRLETAAQRLADPGRAHLSIGAVSYGCGFVNQAHFSKRFRDRFGVSPRDHRRGALLRGEEGSA